MSRTFQSIVDEIEIRARELNTKIDGLESIDDGSFPVLIEMIIKAFSKLEQRTTLRFPRGINTKQKNSFEYNLVTVLNYAVDCNLQMVGFAKIGRGAKKIAYFSTDHFDQCKYTECATPENTFQHEIRLHTEYPVSIHCNYSDIRSFNSKDKFVDAARSGLLKLRDTPVPASAPAAKRKRVIETPVECVKLEPTWEQLFCQEIPSQAELPKSDAEAPLYVARHASSGVELLVPNPEWFAFFNEGNPTSVPWQADNELTFLGDAPDSSTLFLEDPLPAAPPLAAHPTEEEMARVTLQWLDQWARDGKWAMYRQCYFYSYHSRMWKYLEDDEFELVVDLTLEDMDEIIDRPDHFERSPVTLIFSVSS